MSDEAQLTAPRIKVVMADGATWEVQTLNPDLIRFDLTRGKHGWPQAQTAPMLWLTFLAWAALRREQTLPADVTWERFSDELCVSVKPLDTDDDEEGPGVPTLPGLEPG